MQRSRSPPPGRRGSRGEGPRERDLASALVRAGRVGAGIGERDEADELVRELLEHREDFETPDLAAARIDLAQATNLLGTAALGAG